MTEAREIQVNSIAMPHLDEPLYEHHGVAEHAASPGSDHAEGDLGSEEGRARDDDVGDGSGQAEREIHAQDVLRLKFQGLKKTGSGKSHSFQCRKLHIRAKCFTYEDAEYIFKISPNQLKTC